MAHRLQTTRAAKDRPPGSFAGDLCANKACRDKNGKRSRLGVYHVHKRGGYIYRFLRCMTCKDKPVDNKLVLPDPDWETTRDLPGQMLLFDLPGEAERN